MNKRTLLLLLAAIFLTVVSCKKDTEVNKDTFKIEKEEVTASAQSVKVSGSYDYAGTIDGITMELGRKADLLDADAYRTLLEGTDFSVEVKNLRTNTTYYYRYSVEYGGKTPYLTEIKSFKTEEYNLPEVKSREVVSVGVNRAEVSGEVISDGGGDAVTLRGICWSMSHNPSVGDEYANAGEGTGQFTCELTNLQPEKTYYARAFAGNSKGVSYGEELTFVTLASGSLAEVRTVGITGNAMLQATVSGEVTNEGTSAVLERGVCYGKEHYPTTNGLHVSSGSGMGEYSCELTNLEANATYYVRAYAINNLGIAYGEEMSFVAQTETTAPVVLTNMVSDITMSSATGHGAVMSDGGAAVTRRGLCWSTEHGPTAEGTHADCGSGVGEFSGLMPHLTGLTTYYVRAFAENAIGMAYGEEVSFTVGQHLVLPTVTTSEVADISATTAVGGGDVTNGGGTEVTERGICWSTSPNPTIEGDHASNGTGTGIYTCMMTGLTPGTTYYVKAYAINSLGIAYGDQIEFVTEAALPAIQLDEVSDAMISYSVTDDGGADVLEHGVCYGTSHNPTISGNHVSGGSGTGSFTVELNDLQPGTTYYWRLYATNSVGVSYGEEHTYATVALPTVTTMQVSGITYNSALGGGNVTSNGNATVTERGICWSTSHDPTTSGSHANVGSGLGSFTYRMTDLTPNTLYYVRAYAQNSVGVAYGDEVSFTTSVFGEWLYYDNGMLESSMGANGTLYWGIMFPAASLEAYAGTILTQVAVMEYEEAGSYTANIYLGGTSAPATLVSTQTFSCTGTQDWKYVTLNTPVPVDGTQNLWITIYQSGINYPATCCTDSGDPNGRWVSIDGTEWVDIATVGSFYYTWMIRGYITTGRGDTIELKPVANKPQAPAKGKTINLNALKKAK
jgi:hypothetical protein